ncbi:hypothetical protein [Emcibacter sp.]|uniref:hypothetical protein n=1 Tax=Emcibacter sp. TaxID=1979954 RepID=UPI002AA74232|nr:hypothetical protein [Emcibacter sp.]
MVKSLKENWYLFAFVFLAGGWSAVFWFNDWYALWEMINKYQIMIGTILALFAAAVAWKGVQLQMISAKNENNLDRLLNKIAAHRMVALELVQNSVVCADIIGFLQNGIEANLLSNQKGAQTMLMDCRKRAGMLSSKIFLQHSLFLAQSKPDIFETASRAYLLIGAIEPLVHLTEKLDSHPQYLGTEEQKAQYLGLINAVEHSKTVFFEASSVIKSEQILLEAEIEKYN